MKSDNHDKNEGCLSNGLSSLKDDDIYMKISHSQRLNIIYMREIHNEQLKDIEDKTGVNYNTVRNIINAYK